MGPHLTKLNLSYTSLRPESSKARVSSHFGDSDSNSDDFSDCQSELSFVLVGYEGSYDKNQNEGTLNKENLGQVEGHIASSPQDIAPDEGRINVQLLKKALENIEVSEKINRDQQNSKTEGEAQDGTRTKPRTFAPDEGRINACQQVITDDNDSDYEDFSDDEAVLVDDPENKPLDQVDVHPNPKTNKGQYKNVFKKRGKNWFELIEVDQVEGQGQILRNVVQGSENSVIGAGNMVKGRLNKINGNNNKIKGSESSVKGTGNVAIGFRNKIIGKNNKINGDCNIITGDGYEIEGNHNNINKGSGKDEKGN